MGLLSNILDGIEATVKEVERDIAPVTTPLEDAVNRLAPSAIQKEADDSGISLYRPSFNQGAPFTEMDLDLMKLDATNGSSFNVNGKGIFYRRQGSTPNAQLEISAAGKVSQFFPGARLDVDFQSLVIRRTSPGNGDIIGGINAPPAYPLPGSFVARLIVFNIAGVNYQEPSTELPGQSFVPALLVSGSSIIALGAFPVVNAIIHQNFYTVVTGWKKIRVFLVAIGGLAVWNEITIQPVIYDASAGQSADPMNSFVMPDSTPAGSFSTISFEYDVEDIDRIGFVVSNPTPANCTSYTFSIQGIA